MFQTTRTFFPELEHDAPQVSVYAHIPRHPARSLPISMQNVLLSLGISILLGHSKVDDVDY